MKAARWSDFKITNEQVSFDDGTLMSMVNRLHEDIVEKKEALDINLKNFNENDYLSTAVARLAYGFTKEEYNSLFDEVKKRGLITE